MEMPPLQTQRLIIRRFVIDDLDAIHRILDIELRDVDWGEPSMTLDERARWLEWTVLGYEELEKLRQPPYGDRAIVLKESTELIGACGFVPLLAPFEQLPTHQQMMTTKTSLNATAFGLYYAVSPQHQGRGYATEAAKALIDYGFTHLNLKRIMAMTRYTNAASIRVMEKAGMHIEKNPYPEPAYLQIVGIIVSRANAS